MGKRGPKPTPGKVLERRRSWRAKRRLAQERGEVDPEVAQAWKDSGGAPLPGETPKITWNPKRINVDKTVRLIPDYDPFRDAGNCILNRQAAQMACGFFRDRLQHVKGEMSGQPFNLKPWEDAIIANLFGWERPDGTRRYRESLVYVPRKNGKTPLGAGIVCYVFLTEGEPGMEVYSAAAEAEQAGLVFKTAKAMMARDPQLAATITPYRYSIVRNDDPLSVYSYVSKSADTKHGYNTHLAVIDELHVCERDLIEVFETSTGARRQPLIIYFTTADSERASICNTKRDYALQVRDGVTRDPAFLPVIYEASRDDDWTNPKVWAMANPNLGVSKKRETMKRECAKAQAVPGYVNTFLRLHLNVKTEQVTRWLPMDKWRDCGQGADPVEWRKEAMVRLAGKQCKGALDLGSTRDITAFALLFDDKEGGYDVLPWFWVPQITADRREKQNIPQYLVWIREGFLTQTHGEVADYNQVIGDLVEINKQFAIEEVAIDRLYHADQVAQALAGEHGFNMVKYGQTMLDYAAPAKRFEELVVETKIRHGNNPVLHWMASNVCTYTDNMGNIKPVKPKPDSPLKVDGIQCCVMALGRHLFAEPEQPSVYRDRGLLVLG